MTPRKHWHSLMPFPRYRESEGDRAIVPIACSATVVMTLRQSGKVCVPFRRLRVRYERRADIHEAFLSLGCALICWRFLRVDRVAR
jgi:hypothetical protein